MYRVIFVFINCLWLCIPNCFGYWQQHCATKINVTLDDNRHYLRAFEQLTYTNNSPDTLQFILFHLWPNAYKNDRTAFCEQQIITNKSDFYYASENQRGFIDSLNFECNGVPLNWDYYQQYEDVIKITLAQPLAPGASLSLQTPFRVKIPQVFSRLGHKGQAYYISQWYPKPAVYDSLGWHPLPYLDQGEFYSEFGSFEVDITLPANYIVMASGQCQSEEETKWLNELSRQALPSDTLYRFSMPASSLQNKTVRFSANNIHDFAWFADKRWIVRCDSMPIPSTQKSVYINVAYLPIHQKQWEAAIASIKKSILYFSEKIGTYPYPVFSAVEGDLIAGAGMEYPGAALIEQSSADELERVIVHEIGHNWFYGALGTNERFIPWMDESINSFYEQKLLNSGLKDSALSQIFKKNVESILWYQRAIEGKDQAVDLASAQYNATNYGLDVYVKGALLFSWLESYMGEADFATGMQRYFKDWSGKHPQITDLKNALISATNKDINWFFDFVLSTNQNIDFSYRKENRSSLLLKQNTNSSLPLLLSYFKKDSLLSQQWTSPFLHRQSILLADSIGADKLVVGPSWIDGRLENNVYYFNNRFLKHLPRLGLGFGYRRGNVAKLYLMPVAGYNVYDGFLPGMLIHNLTLPQHRFQFALLPQWGVYSKQPAGVAAISYSWFPKNLFQEIRVQSNYQSYSQAFSSLNVAQPVFSKYWQLAPRLELVFKNNSALSTKFQKLTISNYFVKQSVLKFERNLAVDSLYRPDLYNIQNGFWGLHYNFKQSRSIHPYEVKADLQLAKTFTKFAITAMQRIDYDTKGKSLFVRAFFGKMWSDDPLSNYGYWWNSTYTGKNDYLYNQLFVARNNQDGFWSKQIVLQDAAFKVPTNLYANPLGRSGNWLMALNLKTDLPLIKFPLRFFVDIASYAAAKKISPSGSPIAVVSGLQLDLFKDALGIYLPLFLSKDYKNYLNEMYPQSKVWRSISFSVNLQQFNLLRSSEYLFQTLNQ